MKALDMDVTDFYKVESQDLTINSTWKVGEGKILNHHQISRLLCIPVHLPKQLFKGQVHSFNEESILLLKNHKSCHARCWPSVLDYNAIVAKPK